MTVGASEAEALRKEVGRLRQELQEAEETIQAIREGRVDAFVVGRNTRHRVYTLESGSGPYRILVEAMEQCAVTIAPDSTIVYANRQTSKLLDRRPDELVGQPFRALVAEADRSQFDAVVSDAAESPMQGEIRLQRADGTLVPVYFSSGGRSSEDHHDCVCFLITDLTQQKKHEELIVAENLARSMLQQAADAVVVCDPGGTIAFASPGAHELCGQNPLGQRFSVLFPLSFPGDVKIGFAQPFEPEKLDEPVRGIEACLPDRGLENKSLLLSAGPVRDGNGILLGCVVTLTDISVLKRAEQKLRDADRRKDEFLAVLAHELRNPLAPIVTGLDVIDMAGDAGGTSTRALGMIKRQVHHLTRLVDDLLEISRITLGKIALQKEVLNLGDVVANALDTTRSEIEESRHSIKVDVPERIRIEADPVRLSQVIVNLLNNAARYTAPGGEIRLSARAEDGRVELRVRDSGSGIAPESLGEVFTMFSQSRRANRLQEGLGVGLALVRRIVELHGGSVEAASEGIGRGSEFTIRIPIGNVDGETHPVEPRPDVGEACRKRVLVVDDNQDSAMSLGMLLDMLECEVKVAFDGESALSVLDSFPADTIFLDIDMPQMDGYEVARRVRQREEAKDATLIALTGWGQEDDRRMTREAGFDHHLLKPISVDSLRGLLADPGRAH